MNQTGCKPTDFKKNASFRCFSDDKYKVFNKFSVLGLILAGFLTFFASAYIPSYSLILSQVAYSQGKGAYRIEQTVYLEPNQLVLTETWWVEPTGLRVDVQGHKALKGLSLRFIYKGGKKIFKDENNQRQSQPLSRYHIEWPFHLRSADKLKKLFSLWQAGPFHIPKRDKNQGSDPFVTLVRKGGREQYKISHSKGQVWVEQDEFVIHGWQWPTGESLKASGFKLYPRNLFFPEKRFLRYAVTQSAHIQLKKIQSLKPNKNRLKLSWLKKSKHYPSTLSSADQDAIRAFYKKYR